jgi:hypothetical protein
MDQLNFDKAHQRADLSVVGGGYSAEAKPMNDSSPVSKSDPESGASQDNHF